MYPYSCMSGYLRLFLLECFSVCIFCLVCKHHTAWFCLYLSVFIQMSLSLCIVFIIFPTEYILLSKCLRLCHYVCICFLSEFISLSLFVCLFKFLRVYPSFCSCVSPSEAVLFIVVVPVSLYIVESLMDRTDVCLPPEPIVRIRDRLYTRIGIPIFKANLPSRFLRSTIFLHVSVTF